MYDVDMETVFIQSVTSYLQYFKTYFGLAFQLIECHLFRDKLLAHTTLQSAVEKITLKKIDIKLSFSPFLLQITEHNKSYIDRFYMRIVQYLQYRLNSIFKSNEIDPKFSVIINQFMNNLHKIFKTIIGQMNNKDLHGDLLIGNVLYEVQYYVKRMFQSMFNCLQRTTGKESTLVLEEIRLSRTTIQEHIFGPFNKYLMSFLSEKQDLEESVINSRQQSYINSKSHFDNRNHYRSKSQFNIESLHSLNSKSLRQYKFLVNNKNRQYCSNKTQLKKDFGLSNQYMEGRERSQCLQKKAKKNSYSEMLSIMQIEGVQVYSREYIMNELKAKNIKNKLMINKFLKVYKKKQKRHKKKLSFMQKGSVVKFIQEDCQMEQIADENNKTIDNEQIIIEKEGHAEVDHPQSLKEKIIAICSSHHQQQKQNLIKSMESQQLTPIHKHRPNPKLQPTVKQLTLINPIIPYHSQFQSSKGTFLYKEGEKLSFEHLRHKMNLQFQKVSSPSQFKKDFLQFQALKKLNRMPGQKFLSQELREKPSQRSLGKKTTIKGSNFSSFVVNQTRNKSCHSNSEMLQKNQLQLNNNLQTLTLSALQCSSLQKINPKHRIIKSLLSNEQISSKDSKFQALIKIDDRMKRNSQVQNPMIVLPRIFVGSIKKNHNKLNN